MNFAYQVYKYSTDNEELATADSEGKVTTHGGPGSFTVRAAMVKGEHNYDEAKVTKQAGGFPNKSCLKMTYFLKKIQKKLSMDAS